MSITKDIRDAFEQRDNAVPQYIIINVVVFAVLIVIQAVLALSGHNELSNDPTFRGIMRQLELSSSLSVLLRHPWTPFTYAFTHKDPFHIFFNMLNLYYFGRLIQEYLGSRRFISLYILGGLAGAALYLVTYNTLPVFRGAEGVGLIGASASVVAIIVAAATLLPDYTFMLLLFGAVRIKYIALFVILVSSVKPIYEGNPGGGLAHLGGALLGYIFIKQMKAGRDMGKPVIATGQWLGHLFDRRPALKVTHRGTASAGSTKPAANPKSATAAEEEVNGILDKISRSGYESLSKEEKQKLFQASQQ
ncbi:MAG: rhomboid family intramembrane serine protease [Janthinobacterium lividum]